jgi:hypothetical protein
LSALAGLQVGLIENETSVLRESDITVHEGSPMLDSSGLIDNKSVRYHKRVPLPWREGPGEGENGSTY